jgi:uncharacterized LabA/DUF88 family protein
MVAYSPQFYERVMVFIDGSNILWGSKERGFRIDHGKLVEYLVGSNRRMVRPYFFCSIGSPPSPEQIRFQDALKFKGFEVVSKPLRFRQFKAREVGSGRDVFVEKWGEKGVDVSLVTFMLSMGWKNAYDTALLIGGDEDYLPAVMEVKQIPKRVEIAAFSDTDASDPPRFKNTINRGMRMVADRFYPLETLRSSIERV